MVIGGTRGLQRGRGSLRGVGILFCQTSSSHRRPPLPADILDLEQVSEVETVTQVPCPRCTPSPLPVGGSGGVSGMVGVGPLAGERSQNPTLMS